MKPCHSHGLKWGTSPDEPEEYPESRTQVLLWLLFLSGFHLVLKLLWPQVFFWLLVSTGQPSQPLTSPVTPRKETCNRICKERLQRPAGRPRGCTTHAL